MNKLLEALTKSVQSLTTMAAFSTTTGVSGSAVVDMSKHNQVMATVHVGKLPDNKGALSMSTLSLYECLSTGLTGSLITSSVKTSSAISNSAEFVMSTGIKAEDLSPGFRYVYAHFNTNTKSDNSVIITRGAPRYEPQ